jgi:hypothetical protein
MNVGRSVVVMEKTAGIPQSLSNRGRNLPPDFKGGQSDLSRGMVIDPFLRSLTTPPIQFTVLAPKSTMKIPKAMIVK